MGSKTQTNVPWWIALIGLLGGLVIGNTTASLPTNPTPVTTTTTIPLPPQPTTTIKVSPTAEDVTTYFNPNASWNQPVSKLGRAEGALQQYAKRLYNYGGGTAPPGRIGVAFGDYSVPWYPKSDATTKARIYQATWAQELYQSKIPVGTEIPWNPNWKPGTGSDQLLTVIDEKTGEVWELGGIGQLKINCFDFFGPNGRAGYDQTNPNHICTTGGAFYSNLYTASDKDKSTISVRGAGFNKTALITRAAEVKSGAIKHALELTITATMFGQPACNPINSSNATGFGVTCGGYIPPATQLERAVPDRGCAPQVVSAAERSKTIPHGMRFAIDISDADITKWLDSRGYTGRIRETARIFAVALRDYGWIPADTGCYGMHIETDSAIAGAAAPIWKELGVPANGDVNPKYDLLYGLFTADNIYVVAAPT